MAEHPPGHPPRCFRLPGRLCLSICPAGLRSPTGSPALPGMSRDGDPWGGTLQSPQLWGSRGITARPQLCCKGEHGGHPRCQSHPARCVLPGHPVWAGSGRPECPAEMPRLWAPHLPNPMTLGQLLLVCPMPWVREHPALAGSPSPSQSSQPPCQGLAHCKVRCRQVQPARGTARVASCPRGRGERDGGAGPR